MIERGAGGVALSRRLAALECEQAHLAEVSASRQIGEHELFAAVDLRDFHKADADEIEGVGVRTFLGDHLAGSEADQFDAVLQEGDEILVERGEDRDAEQMGAQCAGAVVAVELLAEGLVLLHHVEHVAQHLEHDAVGLGADRRRARIEAHAGHFAEEIAGAEFGDGIVVGQVDRGVDGDEGAIAGFAFALFFFLREQLAGDAGDEAGLLLGIADMGARRGDIDVGFAVDDVESGRAVLAFAHDDLAGLDAALDDGAAIEFEEGAGDVLEDRHRQQRFDFRAERLGMDLEQVLAEHALVSQRAGRAGDHAFAAGDAGGVAHRLVVVEGDGGVIALALAGDDEVVANLGAAADAAVAEDAGGVIDVDGERGIVRAEHRHGALEIARRGEAVDSRHGQVRGRLWRPASRVRSRRCAAGACRARDGRRAGVRRGFCGRRGRRARRSGFSCPARTRGCMRPDRRARRNRQRRCGRRRRASGFAGGRGSGSECRLAGRRRRWWCRGER